MRNFQDTFYAWKRVSTRFKKPCSPVFLNNYKQNKTKDFQHTFADTAKETACEKNRRKETLYLDVVINLNKRPDLWKPLSKVIYIIFHCRTSIITKQGNLCLYQKFISSFTDALTLYSIMMLCGIICFLIVWLTDSMQPYTKILFSCLVYIDSLVRIFSWA